FQPSEFVKFGLLLFVADLLAKRSERVDDWRWTLAPVTAYLVLVSVLIMLQPNLGTTIIIAGMVLVMLLAAGVRLGPLFVTGAAGAGASRSSPRCRTSRASASRTCNPWWPWPTAACSAGGSGAPR